MYCPRVCQHLSPNLTYSTTRPTLTSWRYSNGNLALWRGGRGGGENWNRSSRRGRRRRAKNPRRSREVREIIILISRVGRVVSRISKGPNLFRKSSRARDKRRRTQRQTTKNYTDKNDELPLMSSNEPEPTPFLSPSLEPRRASRQGLRRLKGKRRIAVWILPNFLLDVKYEFFLKKNDV